MSEESSERKESHKKHAVLRGGRDINDGVDGFPRSFFVGCYQQLPPLSPSRERLITEAARIPKVRKFVGSSKFLPNLLCSRNNSRHSVEYFTSVSANNVTKSNVTKNTGL